MSERISPLDVRLRVIAIAMEPALTLARIMALPMDDLTRIASAGYFREARARGMSFRAIARRFNKSLRTITNLARVANDQGVPLATSQRVTWRRRIAELVATRGPTSEDELVGLIVNADEAAVREELERLLEQGILLKQGGDIDVAAAHFDLVQDELSARLDSLRHFLGVSTQVAYRRFFAAHQDGEAFARVFTFRARPEALSALRERVYEELKRQVFAADSAAEGDDEAVGASVSFCVVATPADGAWGPKANR